MEIKKLDKNIINAANSVSFYGMRGTSREKTYRKCVDEILSWNISENKKQQLLDILYKKNMEILKCEASHVSVIVAGPANYNSKKYDKGDQIFRLSNDFYDWMVSLKKQYDKSQDNKTEDQYIIQKIYKLNEMNLNITENLKDLAILNVKEFIRIFEEFYPSYKWRKNSNIYKTYESAKEGKLEEKNEKIIFEDENYKLYSKKDRIFIKFIFQPKRQLIVALKKRGYFWNSRECAWSTYIQRYERNKEWAENISNQYKEYI